MKSHFYWDNLFAIYCGRFDGAALLVYLDDERYCPRQSFSGESVFVYWYTIPEIVEVIRCDFENNRNVTVAVIKS
jgi:hypothetical protein